MIRLRMITTDHPAMTAPIPVPIPMAAEILAAVAHLVIGNYGNVRNAPNSRDAQARA